MHAKLCVDPSVLLNKAQLEFFVFFVVLELQPISIQSIVVLYFLLGHANEEAIFVVEVAKLWLFD